MTPVPGRPGPNDIVVETWRECRFKKIAAFAAGAPPAGRMAMLLAAAAVTTLLELRTVDLGTLLGWYPPGWGSPATEVRLDYPGLVLHTGHADPDAGSPSGSRLHLHEPAFPIAGSRPRYLDFGCAPWGLELVSIEYAREGNPRLFALGPPSCMVDGAALWRRRRNVVIAVLGSSIWLAEPISESASMLERFLCRRT